MASVQPGDCEHPSVRAQSLTCHDDMKDTGRPLFPHSVGGRAEEGAVVHGVPGGVAQPAHPALADSPHVGHPAHHKVVNMIRGETLLWCTPLNCTPALIV